MSFEEIMLKFNMSKKRFSKYLQLRSFIFSMQNQSLKIPSLSSLEEVITKDCRSSGLIALIYSWLASGSKEASASKLHACGADLKVNISGKEWSVACEEAQTQTANTALK